MTKLRARRWLLLAYAICFSTACLREESQVCPNGGICPPGLLCVATEYTTIGSRACAAGTCGNGVADRGEVCDDGNNRSGDGCPADCMQPCGDGVRDPEEICDDGNTSDGDGCAADCSSLNGGLWISPQMVDVVTTEGAELPTAVVVQVRLEYPGDRVLVGYPPGVPQPSWLSIAERDATTSTTELELELQMTDTSVVGPRSTTVRMVISRQNSSGIETLDLPVTYHVELSDLAVATTPPALAFTATVDDLVMPSQTVSVAFNGEDLALESAPPWAAVALPPLPPTSPASISIAIDDTALAPGTRSGEIVLRTAREGFERRAIIAVDYQLLAAPALEIQATPQELSFTAVAGGPAPPAQAVNVSFSGASLSVISAPSWARVSGPPAAATSPASLSVEINTTAFAGGSEHSGDLVIQTARAGERQTTTIALDYQVLPVPEVQFVAPYVGTAGRSGTVLVRGRGFPVSHPVRLRVGDVEVGPVTADSDTQIRLSYPALPAGRYRVTLLEPSAIAPTAPELVIVPPPPFTYQAIDSPGPLTRIVYDAERQAIYGVNESLQQLERFAYANGTWSRLAPHVVPLLTDIAMAPDGRSLTVIDRYIIHEARLTTPSWSLLARAHLPSSFCSFFGQAAAANNGKIFLHSWSGYCPSYFYDTRDHSLQTSTRFYLGRNGSSADGTHIYARGASSFDLMEIYDALSDTMEPISSNLPYWYSTSISRGATRTIVNDEQVYDHALTLTGTLAYRGPFAALVARDASRAFVYGQTHFSAQLEVYDLTAPPGSDGVYPLLQTIPLADRANLDGYAIHMTSSADDSVVFVSGAGKLLVIPVH